MITMCRVLTFGGIALMAAGFIAVHESAEAALTDGKVLEQARQELRAERRALTEARQAAQQEQRIIEVLRSRTGADDGALAGRLTIALAEASIPSVMIGIHMDEVDVALCRHLDIEPGSATLVRHVTEGLAAANGGVELYDVIIAVDDERPASPARLRTILAEAEPGQAMTLAIIRKAQPLTLSITPEKFDRQRLQGDTTRIEVQMNPTRWEGGPVAGMPYLRGAAPDVFFDDGMNSFYRVAERVAALPSRIDETRLQAQLESEIARLEQKVEASIEMVMTKVLEQVEILLDRIQRELKAAEEKRD